MDDKIVFMEESNLPVESWVIFADDDILVIHKPAGVLSIADGYNPALAHLRTLLEPVFNRLWVVHRLDQDTSGLMVLARSAEAHRELNRQFRAREVGKTYHALVSPAPAWESLEMREPLRVNTGRAHLTRVDLKLGKPAWTNCRVCQDGTGIALVECTIGTGYRHQVRAHLYHHGLGILGDPLYHPPGMTTPGQEFSRLMLHACQLEFTHPRTARLVRFEVNDPVIFGEILAANQAQMPG